MEIDYFYLLEFILYLISINFIKLLITLNINELNYFMNHFCYLFNICFPFLAISVCMIIFNEFNF